MKPSPKPLHFIRRSRDDLREFPEDVRKEIGFALHLAEFGEKASNALPLKGFGGASVLEVIANFDGDTFRCMYTVRWPKAVYVLHAFQKKSKSGRSTPKTEIDLVRSRLRDAERHYKDTYEKEDRPQTRPGGGR